MHTISPSRIAVHVNCTQLTLVPLTKLLQLEYQYRCFIRVLSCIAFSLQFLASQQNEKIKQKLRLPADKRKKRKNNKKVKRHSKCSPSSKTLAKSGLEPDSYTNHTDQSQPLYRLSHLRASSNSKIIQFRIRVHCSPTNQPCLRIKSCNVVCLHPTSLSLVTEACKERK